METDFFKNEISHWKTNFIFPIKKIWGGGKLFWMPVLILFHALSFSLLMADVAEIKKDAISFSKMGKI